MKKIVLLAAVAYISQLGLIAQGNGAGMIKLFVTAERLAANNQHLDSIMQQRLYNKMVQLINQSSIAEIGYSNFWVMPKLDVLDVSVSKAGIRDVHLARCELFISVSRTDFGSIGGATYASFSKRITGSGSSEKEALANAINSIRGNDSQIDSFFIKTKAKIYDYYNTHCKEIMKEADQATQLNLYEKAIALYFSIPSTSPCYSDAHEASVLVYRKFHQSKCQLDIFRLKSLVAQIQSRDESSMQAYKEVLDLVQGIAPSYQVAPECFALAEKEIQKIEQRFSDAEKKEWELLKKRAADLGEYEREMAKSMGKMNVTYQPPAPKTDSNNNVIIVK